MNKYTILVVEDEALIAAHLVKILSSLGYTVYNPVATGEDAIRSVTTRQPDLVLMDIELIGAMTGIEAAEKIRAIADIPIVYLTAYNDDLRLRQARLTEPYGYIVKPAHSPELHATIEMAMYKHALDRKLKESEERNRSIVEALPGILFHFSADGRFIDCQFNKGDLLLLQPDQIIGKQVAEILPPYLAHLTGRKIRETLESGQLQTFEYSLSLHDQEHFFEARMITSGTSSVLAFIYDITERKRAEEALRMSDQKYHDIFKNSVTGLFKTTPDGSLIDVNDAFARLYDHPGAAEMLADSTAGKHLYISRHLYANPEERKEINQILAEKGKIENYETLHIKRDGTHVWVSITARAIRDAEGTVLFYEGTVIDITKRKKAEAALKKSQVQLEEAMDLAHLVNWEFDVASGIFTFDDRFYALYGTTAELEGGTQMPADMYAKKFVHPDDQFIVADEVNKAIQATDPLYVSHVEHRIMRRNGEIRHIVVRIGITKDEKGRTIKTHGANQDITGRKLAEAALAESEERFRLLLQHVPSVSVQGYSMDGTTHYWNDASESLYGYTAQEAVGKNLVDLVIPPEMKDDVRKAMTYMADSGQPIPASELSLMRKDGSRVAVFSSHAIVKRTVGGTELFCIDIDLTERKRVEEALRESEEKFRLISESSPDHIFIQDSNLRYTWVLNPQLGLTPEDMIGKTDYDFLSKEDADVLAPVKRQVLETGKTIPYVTSLSSSRRESEYFEGVYLPKYDNEGRIDGVMGYFRNITERKLVEEALKASETQLRATLESTADGILAVDNEGKVLKVSRRFAEIWKIPPSILECGDDRTLLDFVVSQLNEPDAFLSKVQSLYCSDAEDMDTITFRDGRFFERYSSPMIIDGARIGRVWSFRDVTERKRMELELKTALESLKEAHRLAHIGTWDWVMETDTVIWSEELYNIAGRDPSLPAPTYTEHPRIYTQTSWDLLSSAVMSALETGETYNLELELVRPDGSIRWVNTFGGVKRDEKGKVIGLHGTVQDTTERKRAEEAIRQANKKLNLLFSITRHDINNQLTVQMGYLLILEKKQPDATHNEYFEKVSTAAKRISAMIQFTKEYEEIGVHAPIWLDCHSLVDTAATQAPLGKVIVRNDLPANVEVFADPLIIKVCYNLIDNALRYGGKITTIRFSVEQLGDDHMIVCEDDGDGVPAGEKEKIFERGLGKNTGMGLFLSCEILDITGITIRETGAPGKGARFEIMVPKGAYRAGK